MSLRLEMLQVARVAPRQLLESAELVASFLKSQLNPDGGFKNRAGVSDLYYTVFGLEGMLALRADLPAAAVAGYLRTFGSASELDLVHAASLARCWAALPEPYRSEPPREQILKRIENFRSADGAYSVAPAAKQGTLYGCFMAYGAYQDFERPFPDVNALLACIEKLKASDGGYANGSDLPMGLTPPTAAAATLLRNLGQPVPAELKDWILKRHHPEGGFYATPLAPMPDLLSTATALHALAGMHADIEKIKDPCLDFVDSLWTNKGAFHGNWTDEAVDCEYTYYALLALGHLTL